jgi:hypothetical protein
MRFILLNIVIVSQIFAPLAWADDSESSSTVTMSPSSSGCLPANSDGSFLPDAVKMCATQIAAPYKSIAAPTDQSSPDAANYNRVVQNCYSHVKDAFLQVYEAAQDTNTQNMANAATVSTAVSTQNSVAQNASTLATSSTAVSANYANLNQTVSTAFTAPKVGGKNAGDVCTSYCDVTKGAFAKKFFDPSAPLSQNYQASLNQIYTGCTNVENFFRTQAQQNGNSTGQLANSASTSANGLSAGTSSYGCNSDGTALADGSLPETTVCSKPKSGINPALLIGGAAALVGAVLLSTKGSSSTSSTPAAGATSAASSSATTSTSTVPTSPTQPTQIMPIRPHTDSLGGFTGAIKSSPNIFNSNSSTVNGLCKQGSMVGCSTTPSSP